MNSVGRFFHPAELVALAGARAHCKGPRPQKGATTRSCTHLVREESSVSSRDSRCENAKTHRREGSGSRSTFRSMSDLVVGD